MQKSNGSDSPFEIDLSTPLDVSSFFNLLWHTKKGHKHLKIPGVKIPNTIVFELGKPRFWYFTAKDGCFKRKRMENVRVEKIVDHFDSSRKLMNMPWQCRREINVAGLFIPKDRTIPVTYLDQAGLRQHFDSPISNNGLLQEFAIPRDECNESLRAEWTPTLTVLERRTNINPLHSDRVPMAEKLLTFGGASATSCVDAYVAEGTLYRRVRSICESIAAHVHIVTGHFPQRMVVYLKCGLNNQMWLLWCDCLQIFKPPPPEPTSTVPLSRLTISVPQFNDRLRKLAAEWVREAVGGPCRRADLRDIVVAVKRRLGMDVRRTAPRCSLCAREIVVRGDTVHLQLATILGHKISKMDGTPPELTLVDVPRSLAALKLLHLGLTEEQITVKLSTSPAIWLQSVISICSNCLSVCSMEALAELRSRVLSVFSVRSQRKTSVIVDREPIPYFGAPPQAPLPPLLRSGSRLLQPTQASRLKESAALEMLLRPSQSAGELGQPHSIDENVGLPRSFSSIALAVGPYKSSPFKLPDEEPERKPPHWSGYGFFPPLPTSTTTTSTATATSSSAAAAAALSKPPLAPRTSAAAAAAVSSSSSSLLALQNRPRPAHRLLLSSSSSSTSTATHQKKTTSRQQQLSTSQRLSLSLSALPSPRSVAGSEDWSSGSRTRLA